MAQSNKLDAFFKERINELEVPPMPESWGKVQQSLPSKKTPWAWIGITATAAMIAIAFGLFLFTPKGSISNRGENIAGQIDHPKTQAIAWPKISRPEVVQTQKKAKPRQKLVATAPIEKTQQPVTEVVEMPKLAELEPEMKIAIEVAKLDIETEAILEKTEEPKPVKITYIAAETPEGEEKNRLNKMLTAAQKISPADVLADIRDAKNNLLNRN